MSAYSKDYYKISYYKGHYIHGYRDNERMETVVEWQDAATGECYRVKSWRAAQLAITKHVKEKSIESTSSL